MVNVANIQILRSYTNTAPISLLDGQLAYSFVSNTLFIGSNSGVITIGDPSTKQVAQSAYNQANSANILAQAAFNAANAAGSSALTQAAYNQANSANILAQSSYDFANTAAANISIIFGVDLTQNTWIASNAVFTQSAYTQANSANILAQAAFNAANAAGSSTYVQSAYNQANSANVLAQSAYNAANSTNTLTQSVYNQANSANVLAQSSFNQANSANVLAQSGYNQANSANILAQAAFNAANAAGSSTYVQAAFDKANSANVLAQSSYNFANTINVFSYSAYSQANTSSFLGQSAYNKANSANVLAQAAYDAANAAGSSTYVQAAFDKANSANVLAQSSYNFANTVNTYSYSSNVFLQNSISSTNTAMKAYVDQANTGMVSYVVSTNTAMKSYVDQANVGMVSYVVASNTAMKSYVDQANTGLKSYVDQANTGMASYVVSSNTAMKAYVDQANTGLKSYGDQTYFGKSGGTISGSVTIQNNLTVNGNVTYTGNVTSVQVTGNTGQFFGYTANGFNALYAGVPIGYLIEPQIITQFTANYNGYAGVNHQNINSGANSSSDVFLTADNGTANDGYVDLGIGSSTYNYPGYSLIGPNDGYLFATGNTTTGGGKMIIGTGLNNDVVIATGGLNTTNEVMRVTSANTVLIKSPIAATNTTTGALQVTGGISTQNDVQASNVYSQGTNLLGFANTIQSNVVYLLGNTTPNLYNTSISSSVNSIAVGGAPVQNAAVWRTYTMVQVVDAILFPTLGPTYTVPTITLSANNSGTFEIGQSINQSLTVTGTKNDAGAFTQLRINRNAINLTANNSPTATPVANIATQYGYADPNNQNYSYANTYIDSNTIVSGSTTWTGYGNYSAGLAKQTNKGTTDSNAFAVLSTTAPQAANNANFATTSTTITGIYPYFWGVSSTQPTAASIASSIQAGTATRVLAVGSGTLTITYNASSQYIWLAVQTGYAAKTTWYNTALNNGSIGAGQFILAGVSQAVTSPSAYWSGVTFNIYISGYATTTSGSIQFS